MTSFGFGGSNLETGGPNTNPEFGDMDPGNPPWRHGSAFSQKSQKALKTNAKRRVPDPTNPFGNPLGSKLKPEGLASTGNQGLACGARHGLGHPFWTPRLPFWARKLPFWARNRPGGQIWKLVSIPIISKFAQGGGVKRV